MTSEVYNPLVAQAKLYEKLLLDPVLQSNMKFQETLEDIVKNMVSFFDARSGDMHLFISTPLIPNEDFSYWGGVLKGDGPALERLEIELSRNGVDFTEEQQVRFYSIANQVQDKQWVRDGYDSNAFGKYMEFVGKKTIQNFLKGKWKKSLEFSTK